MIAMVGKNCVAIASDTRFGIQHTTVSTNFSKVFRVTEKTFVGFPGLASDTQTMLNKLRFRLKLYSLDEDREMQPQIISNLLQTLLYEKRFGPFFVEPVVAGLDKNNEPFISAMDLIGAPLLAKDFVLAGTSSEALYGMCETLYKPDMVSGRGEKKILLLFDIGIFLHRNRMSFLKLFLNVFCLL